MKNPSTHANARTAVFKRKQSKTVHQMSQNKQTWGGGKVENFKLHNLISRKISNIWTTFVWSSPEEAYWTPHSYSLSHTQYSTPFPLYVVNHNQRSKIERGKGRKQRKLTKPRRERSGKDTNLQRIATPMWSYRALKRNRSRGSR